MSRITKGEIYWANLSPTVGSEISKTRPVLIVSNDINNQYADLVTILPITSKLGNIYPFEVPIKGGMGGLKEPGKIKANQIRTVDKRRLSAKPLGPPVEDHTMSLVDAALKLHLNLS